MAKMTTACRRRRSNRQTVTSEMRIVKMTTTDRHRRNIRREKGKKKEMLRYVQENQAKKTSKALHPKNLDFQSPSWTKEMRPRIKKKSTQANPAPLLLNQKEHPCMQGLQIPLPGTLTVSRDNLGEKGGRKRKRKAKKETT